MDKIPSLLVRAEGGGAWIMRSFCTFALSHPQEDILDLRQNGAKKPPNFQYYQIVTLIDR